MRRHVLRRSVAVALVESAEVHVGDGKPGLVPHLSRHCLRRGFGLENAPTRHPPLPTQRLVRAPYQQKQVIAPDENVHARDWQQPDYLTIEVVRNICCHASPLLNSSGVHCA